MRIKAFMSLLWMTGFLMPGLGYAGECPNLPESGSVPQATGPAWLTDSAGGATQQAMRSMLWSEMQNNAKAGLCSENADATEFKVPVQEPDDSDDNAGDIVILPEPAPATPTIPYQIQ